MSSETILLANHVFNIEYRYKCSFYHLPGCRPPVEIGGNLLTSRTYNIALENNCYTCEEHRYFRKLERKLAKTILSRNREEYNPAKRFLEKTLLDSPQRRDVDVYSLPSTAEVFYILKLYTALAQLTVSTLINQ